MQKEAVLFKPIKCLSEVDGLDDRQIFQRAKQKRLWRVCQTKVDCAASEQSERPRRRRQQIA